MIRDRRGRAIASAIALFSLIAASCGSDKKASPETTSAPPATTATTSAPAATTAATTAETVAAATTEAPPETAGPATGEPIPIMTIATLESPNFSVPYVQTAIEVAVADVNLHGGVNGRPLDPHFCNDKFDPNEAAACARQAKDVGAVAVVGGVTPQAPAIFPVLTEEKIPWVGGSGTSGAVELKDPISYPIQGGSPAMLIGVGRTLVTKGGTKFAIVSTDNAASKAGAAAMLQGIQAAGQDAEVFEAPLDTLDYTAIVATALATNPDAVGITSPPDAAPKVVTALNQAGYKGLIATANTNLSQAAIDALGPIANGVYLGFRMVPTSNTDNPTVAAFLTAIKAKQADIRIDELGLNAWTAVHFLAEVLRQSKATDGAGVISFLDNISTPIELGSVPPYGSLQAPADFPRAKNFVTIIGQVVDGKIVQQGDFVAPLG